MVMGSISIQSNLSLILIVIIIILVCVYFYLDMRKLKLQITNLEKNNDSFIKEFDRINMGLHTIFKNGVKTSDKENVNEPVIVEGSNVDTKVTKVTEEKVNDELFFNINSNTNIKDNSEDNSEEKQNVIDMMTDENTVTELLDDNDELTDALDGDDQVESDDEVDEEVEDSDDDDDEVIELDNSNGVDMMEGLDELINSDIIVDDIDININSDLNKYLGMSVKELKEKCIELGLKHSGNKHTLAQRIVDKLG